MNKENIEVSDTNVGNIDKDINRCKELIKDKHKEWIGLTNQKAIANVLEAYEKLQNKLLDTMKGTKIIREETPEYIRVTYISKQKIKDKIKKLNNEIKNANEVVAIFKIKEQQALQSLLEESEDK